MRAKIVLGCPAVPKRVRLPNGTSFVARYERTSRKNLPGNIRVTRTVGPRNKRQTRVKKKGKVQFSKYIDTGQGKKNQKKKRKKEKKIQENAIW